MIHYLYTDGSSTGRSKREWGWAYIIVKKDKIIGYDYGGGDSGTNNLGELSAAFFGLKQCLTLGYKHVMLVSDSMYVINLVNQDCVPTKYLDIINEIWSFKNKMGIKTKWVAGHSGDTYNEIVDKMAKQGKKAYE
jgi:ribonuclease HI